MLVSFITSGGFWSFFPPILSGTITALVWVFVIWAYTWYRDRKLGKDIQMSVSKIGISMGIDGIGITIDNSIHIPIIVRRVEMLLVAMAKHRELEVGAPAGSLVLNYMGPTEIGAKRGILEKDIRNFVTLPPYTTAQWGINPEWVNRHPGLYADRKFAGCKITIEYMTLLKKPKLLEIELRERMGLSASELFNDKLKIKQNE